MLMRYSIIIAIVVGLLATSDPSIADQQTKKVSWIYRTSSIPTGSLGGIPSDGNTEILLLPEIEKEWHCIVDGPAEIVSRGLAKERSLVCFHKDQQGFFTGFTKDQSRCLLDGTKQGTELAHLTIGVASLNPDKSIKTIYMDLDLFCEAK